MKTIGVYSYVLRGVDFDLPFVESIRSCLPIADEIHVVTDPRFKDGTFEALSNIDGKVNVHAVELDFNNPAIDGATKALARSKCQSDILMQIDADEVLRVEDYPKIKALKDNWPQRTNIIAAGVINWFNGPHFKLSSAGWTKERFSLNDPNITHGIPVQHRIQRKNINPATKEPYIGAKPGTSDGAGYMTVNGGHSIQADNFLCSPDDILKDIKSKDSVYLHHYSWYSIPRKWEMKLIWHYMWGLLYGTYESLDDYTINLDNDLVDFWGPVQHKPGWQLKQPILDEMQEKSIVRVKGIEHPTIMKEWIARQRVYAPGIWWRGKNTVINKMGTLEIKR